LKPLSALPQAKLLAVRGVLADIDDTLSTAGRITAAAYSAMERLRAAGLLVIPITGRPAGWCDHIARMWPVDGVVGENGAFYMRYDDDRRQLVTRLAAGAAGDPARRERLRQIGERILREVPGAAWASDQGYRVADIAIDYCEDVPRLTLDAVARIVALMREAGLTAKVSSIHVNGWFGAYDKLGMTRALLAEVFGTDLDARREQFVFIGDSPNDAPMFGFFPLSVGVANVRDYAGRIEPEPRFITAARSGAGFVELAEVLLARARRQTAERAAPVSLRAITPENARAICRLSVREDQRHLVATNAESLAQAYAHPEAWPRAIYAGETPVGFLMLEDRTQPPLSEAHDEVGLWRFMIDAAFQGLGFGTAALRLAIAQARTRPGVRRMLLSYVPDDRGAGAFYGREGFRETGTVDDGECVMALEFEPS
jgi:HAD superfamily hydrolase (TIGR01484 family)